MEAKSEVRRPMWMGLQQDILEEFASFGMVLRYENEVVKHWGLSIRLPPSTPEALQAHHVRTAAKRKVKRREEKKKAPRCCKRCGEDIRMKRSNAEFCGRKCKDLHGKQELRAA